MATLCHLHLCLSLYEHTWRVTHEDICCKDCTRALQAKEGGRVKWPAPQHPGAWPATCQLSLLCASLTYLCHGRKCAAIPLHCNIYPGPYYPARYAEHLRGYLAGRLAAPS